VDAYLGTRTHTELWALLERGGVIGGSSAGASIMASYLVRGAVDNNDMLMVPGYEDGFGFLRKAAVDQHLIVRNRVPDMMLVLQQNPELLGIGLDEGTALVVQGDRAEVLGRSSAAVYDLLDPKQLYLWLDPGNVYDLGARDLSQLEGTTGGGG
jgi:cyanophycinase